MKIGQCLLKWGLCGGLLLGASTEAAATISLPDSGSCPNTSVPCLQITATTSGGVALSAQVTGSGQGVFGHSDSGFGVWGTAGTGNGIVGTSTSGYGVAATSGSADAVFGSSNSNNGVEGNSGGTGTSGVYGFNSSGSGFGIAGRASGTGIAVYGDNSNSMGWAGYFNGRAFTTLGMWSPSDVRLKKDIKDAAYGLREILQLRPVTYKWKNKEDQGTQVGLIAQELQKVIPEAVVKDPTSEMLSVNYTMLIPLAIGAIQAQQKIINAQEVRIAALERGRTPATSSLFPTGLTGGVALGLLPLWFVADRLRRKKANS